MEWEAWRNESDSCYWAGTRLGMAPRQDKDREKKEILASRRMAVPRPGRAARERELNYDQPAPRSEAHAGGALQRNRARS